ncbi:TPA: hypothetical protein HA231_03580 [Candidatus Woesearchaeota archaeon]|nr:hypothetical protein [Candidatus Woesearchaeota archaeon]
MIDKGILRVGVVMVLLVVALMAFDMFNNFADGYPGSSITAAVVLADIGDSDYPQIYNNIIIKGGTWSTLSIGAAFGSNYYAPDSTCKPGDFLPASYLYANIPKEDEETGEKRVQQYYNVLLYGLDASANPVLKPGGHLGDIGRIPELSFDASVTKNWSEHAGAWVWNDGPGCILSTKFSGAYEMISINDHKLNNNWNLVSVAPRMVGKTLFGINETSRVFITTETTLEESQAGMFRTTQNGGFAVSADFIGQDSVKLAVSDYRSPSLHTGESWEQTFNGIALRFTVLKIISGTEVNQKREVNLRIENYRESPNLLCNIHGAFVFKDGNWEWWEPDRVFSQNDIGIGMWLRLGHYAGEGYSYRCFVHV